MPSTAAEHKTRLAAIERFYQLPDRLAKKTGGPTRFDQFDSISHWPTRGVYFIFEPGESREDSGAGPRVVRVGTHGLKEHSKSTVRKRLIQHRGARAVPGGNHRGSIFRLFIGTAILKHRPKLDFDTWGCGSSAPREVCELERPLKALVSQAIGAMSFICLPIADEPGPSSLRGLIERNAIALLSNLNKPPIDAPSAKWLGKHCPRPLVVRSGLWNSNHLEEVYDPTFLDQLESLIEGQSVRSPKLAPTPPLKVHRKGGLDFSSTLIVIPCSGRKNPGGARRIAGHSIFDSLSPDLARRLKLARRAIAKEVKLDESQKMPAWERYRGALYKCAAPTLQTFLEAGEPPHVLILSGGYGVVHALEPIGDYNSILKLRNWPTGLLSDVIAAYTKHHNLRAARLFAGASTDYAKALRAVEWRRAGVSDAILYSPESARGALLKTPRALGEGLTALLKGRLNATWRSSDGLTLDSISRP